MLVMFKKLSEEIKVVSNTWPKIEIIWGFRYNSSDATKQSESYE